MHPAQCCYFCILLPSFPMFGLSISRKMFWEIRVEIVLGVTRMIYVVSKPSSELCFGSGSCSNLACLTLTKVHPLAIFKLNRKGYDGSDQSFMGELNKYWQVSLAPLLLRSWYLLISLQVWRRTWFSGALLNLCIHYLYRYTRRDSCRL